MAKTDSPLPLSIQGVEAVQRIEKTLPLGVVTRIGRMPQSGWAIPWDRSISREHADLTWNGERLLLQLTANAQNPALYRGQPERTLNLAAGDWFQIGQTIFQLGMPGGRPGSEVPGESTTTSIRLGDSRGYSVTDLRKVQFQNAARQLELLSDLPDAIRNSNSDVELCHTLSQILLKAIPHADAVTVAGYDMTQLSDEYENIKKFPEPLVMQTETRDHFEGRFLPSRRMIWLALREEQSVMHIDTGKQQDDRFTMSEGLGWSFCCPVRGEATRGWCMYVSGQGHKSGSLVITEDDLAPDLRFTEVVAQFIGSIRQVRLLQQQKTQLSTFFSPKVVESLADPRRAAQLLMPAEREISVLFCDVRGFSYRSEQLQGRLPYLLTCVTEALGVMASGILGADGTIADFQGDAALGFWGWPVQLKDGPLPACRAALAIYRRFAAGTNEVGGLLEGFSVGIGVAHGRALAGQIGTHSQAKVGVFGPVVNQGARLEGLTKFFEVPVCIDETTTAFVREGLAPEEARLRVLARLRPKGMKIPITVSALLPPLEEMPQVTANLLQRSEVAVQAVIDGRWDAARAILKTFPEEDAPSRKLLEMMAGHGNEPPADWDGAFTMGTK